MKSKNKTFVNWVPRNNFWQTYKDIEFNGKTYHKYTDVGKLDSSIDMGDWKKEPGSVGTIYNKNVWEETKYTDKFNFVSFIRLIIRSYFISFYWFFKKIILVLVFCFSFCLPYWSLSN